MTSLVSPWPLSFNTSSETSFEVGDAPPQFPLMPAARPATNVPWPRPSPAAFGVSEVSDTSLTTRPPKNELPASMPESTRAIAGACGAGVALAPGFCQKPVTPVMYGQLIPSYGQFMQVDVLVMPLAVVG